ncbi:YjbE family putative metal transport protein [Veillonella sp. YH-vei2232]|uniref:YjbE family putative metal transport protein n=1 Tax=Veillonella absiana TaxID=3079305 RepID=A0ABU3Z8J3_9FIRM|nr:MULTISPECIES: YjbE family putative metal transport protein [unclassified Veillonella]NCB96571.1 TerC family protein [Negativicutes bacterium]MBK7921805.1 YjbE family putative metal transport protein [Veillonella sp.]MBP6923249.1 YjbE family putative metal transport protein [Veillonella sp.]MDV5062958.1 YjbE family putative metal transport protein [Veillonella sp. YH-vei2232]MDV5088237.1 YjbE family putative metal transport protein [Veillonella sp. YH-vei2233]
MEFLELSTWIIIGKIIMIDILLAGDNAVVIGMAAGKLSPDLQKKAILWGTFGAIALRLLFATVLVEALHLIPAIHLGGGLVLLWIAIQLLKGDDEEHNIEAKDSLRGAVFTIIMADAMMSIDNVLGVVGASNGHLEFVSVGMLITVPLIIYGSSIFAKLIGKYPIILLFGGGLLGWVAGEMMVEDPILMPYVQGEELFFKIGTVFFVLIVTAMIKAYRKLKARK